MLLRLLQFAATPANHYLDHSLSYLDLCAASVALSTAIGAVPQPTILRKVSQDMLPNQFQIPTGTWPAQCTRIFSEN